MSQAEYIRLIVKASKVQQATKKAKELEGKLKQAIKR